MGAENNAETLLVEGMTCTNCAETVRKSLAGIGLEEVQVDFITGRVLYQNNKQVKAETISANLNALGYQIKTGTRRSSEHSGSFDITRIYLLIAALFTAPLLLHMVLPFHWLHSPVVQLVLSLPTLYICIVYFGRSAWASLRAGAPNMDVLIFIGSFAAFVYSIWGTFSPPAGVDPGQYLFFETGASIVTLVLLGNFLEKRAVKRTTAHLQQLQGGLEMKARKVTYDLLSGKEESTWMNAEEVPTGSILLINSGEKIPLDGIITAGAATLDESLLTGESFPVSREKGQAVYSGTIVQEGSVYIRSSHDFRHSTLMQIVHQVEQAQLKKPAIQRLGDKVSAIFVPVVLGISVLTFLITWYGLGLSLEMAVLRSIAVLVVSCPCAMGLATPTAIMVGIGRAARNGILFKGGDALELLAKAGYFVFDKTGTLTTGAFQVKNWVTQDIRPEQAQSIVFQMEKHSAHPLAKSILHEYPNWYRQPITFSKVEEIRGQGILALDAEGNEWRLGNRRFTGQVPPSWSQDIILAKNGVPVAGFDVTDTLKPGTEALISKLQQNGKTCILLSGDNEKKVRGTAVKLAIRQYYAGQLPEQKQQLLEKLNAEEITVMVGDGINDGPSLAAAKVGISLGNATDLAQQSASVVITKDRPESILIAQKLAEATYAVIKQNLFWAFFYNIIAIPIAAAGFLSPIIGTAAMALSDVMVIGNSLRLNRKKIKT